MSLDSILKSDLGIVIHTPRLIIQSINESHLNELIHYVRMTQEFLAPFEPLRNPSYYTEQHWEKEVQDAVDLRRRDLKYRFILSQSENPSKIIGLATYSNVVRGPFQAAHLGYSLCQHHQGNGLMKEALQALNLEMFKNANLHRIMANTLATNERSMRLLLSLGFEQEGTAKQYLRIAGNWQDHLLMSLTNHNWRPMPSQD